MPKSSVRTYEALVMRVEEWAQVVVTFKSIGCLNRMNKRYNDGTRYAGKLARTVWSGGKLGDKIKGLPITITSHADCNATSRLYVRKK